jgi:hypothetical protein
VAATQLSASKLERSVSRIEESAQLATLAHALVLISPGETPVQHVRRERSHPATFDRIAFLSAISLGYRRIGRCTDVSSASVTKRVLASDFRRRPRADARRPTASPEAAR